MLLRVLLVAGAAIVFAQAAVAATSRTLTPTRVGAFDVRTGDLFEAGRVFGREDVSDCRGRRCDAIWYSGLTVSALQPAGFGDRTRILSVTLQERGCPAFLRCAPLGRRWRAARGLHIGSTVDELKQAYPAARLVCRACFKGSFTPLSSRWLLVRQKRSEQGRLVFEAIVRGETVKAFRYAFEKT